MDNKKTNGIYEYGKQYDDIHVENMVRLCLEHMDLVNQFFENQKSYYIDDVTNEISVTSPILFNKKFTALLLCHLWMINRSMVYLR